MIGLHAIYRRPGKINRLAHSAHENWHHVRRSEQNWRRHLLLFFDLSTLGIKRNFFVGSDGSFLIVYLKGTLAFRNHHSMDSLIAIIHGLQGAVFAKGGGRIINSYLVGRSYVA